VNRPFEGQGDLPPREPNHLDQTKAVSMPSASHITEPYESYSFTSPVV